MVRGFEYHVLLVLVPDHRPRVAHVRRVVLLPVVHVQDAGGPTSLHVNVLLDRVRKEVLRGLRESLLQSPLHIFSPFLVVAEVEGDGLHAARGHEVSTGAVSVHDDDDVPVLVHGIRKVVLVRRRVVVPLCALHARINKLVLLLQQLRLLQFVEHGLALGPWDVVRLHLRELPVQVQLHIFRVLPVVAHVLLVHLRQVDRTAALPTFQLLLALFEVFEVRLLDLNVAAAEAGRQGV
mmetsp:Transcript_13534/g.33232  ORF Transcript_13534/g.33232 Transcript_13534/m.33232 type:complete len:236 (+) Transcript_13534:1237-1944(+)